MTMKPFLLAALCIAGATAFAADIAEDAYFGRVDLTQASQPEVTRKQPVRIAGGASRSSSAPVYLHVRPDQELRWAAHCHAYQACALPVYFVKESWYRNVYLPRIGGADGREQRYREQVRFERNDREARHRQDDE